MDSGSITPVVVVTYCATCVLQPSLITKLIKAESEVLPQRTERYLAMIELRLSDVITQPQFMEAIVRQYQVELVRVLV